MSLDKGQLQRYYSPSKPLRYASQRIEYSPYILCIIFLILLHFYVFCWNEDVQISEVFHLLLSSLTIFFLISYHRNYFYFGKSFNSTRMLVILLRKYIRQITKVKVTKHNVKLFVWADSVMVMYGNVPQMMRSAWIRRLI